MASMIQGGFMKLRAAGSIALLFVFASAPPAFAWGNNGHRIVCEIAWQRLTPGARQMVRETRAGDPIGSFSRACVWADDVRTTTHPETAGFHFINSPAGQSGVDLARDCGDAAVRCAPWAIEHFAGIYTDASRTRRERNEALKFISHFVGDLHQPLHAGRAEDRGGGRIEVGFFGTPTNLHSVWDTRILRHADIDLGNVSALDAGISDEEVEAWTRPSSPVDLVAWTNESYQHCEQFVYPRVPANGWIGGTYFRPALDITREQIQKAGVRLAYLLNQAAAGTLRFA
jgi:hypothetical protein